MLRAERSAPTGATKHFNSKTSRKKTSPFRKELIIFMAFKL
jgi:hypothetical protein